MKNSIILAAGTGTRLKPLTNHAPKCFTEVNGIPIIKNMLQNLLVTGVEKCTIVTGYLADKIREKLGNSFKTIELEYIHNEIYSQTNDMYSLWLARKTLKNGAIILESDIFFNSDILKNSIKTMNNKSYYIAGKYNGKPGEIYIKVNNKKIISSIKILGKNEIGEIENNSYMSSGLLVIQKEYGTIFSEWMSSSIEKGEKKILFDKILSDHIKESELYIFEIGSQDWVEIDTIQDLHEAEKIFYEKTI